MKRRTISDLGILRKMPVPVQIHRHLKMYPTVQNRNSSTWPLTAYTNANDSPNCKPYIFKITAPPNLTACQESAYTYATRYSRRVHISIYFSASCYLAFDLHLQSIIFSYPSPKSLFPHYNQLSFPIFFLSLATSHYIKLLLNCSTFFVAFVFYLWFHRQNGAVERKGGKRRGVEDK